MWNSRMRTAPMLVTAIVVSGACTVVPVDGDSGQGGKSTSTTTTGTSTGTMNGSTCAFDKVGSTFDGGCKFAN